MVSSSVSNFPAHQETIWNGNVVSGQTLDPLGRPRPLLGGLFAFAAARFAFSWTEIYSNEFKECL